MVVAIIPILEKLSLLYWLVKYYPVLEKLSIIYWLLK
jgi:hypothetical protein